MYHMLRRFNCVNSDKPAVKIDRIAGQAAESTCYHHGIASVESVAFKKSQDVAGSNNLNLIFGDGQRGSRAENGKDAGAGRYVGARLTE